MSRLLPIDLRAPWSELLAAALVADMQRAGRAGDTRIRRPRCLVRPCAFAPWCSDCRLHHVCQGACWRCRWLWVSRMWLAEALGGEIAATSQN